MSTAGKRELIAAARRVVFTGLIILGAWLLLLWLRGHIPESVIRTMLDEDQAPPSFYDSSTWNWTRSLWTYEPVSELIGQRLGLTLKLIGLGGLLSLVIASILLLLGLLLSRVTERPGWLAQVRSILRLVLVSGGASIPVFIVGTFFIVFAVAGRNWTLPENLAVAMFWSILFSSLLPAWLLVQAGHGELTNMPENIPFLRMIPRLSTSLIIRLLRLVGVIIVITVSVEQVMAQPGLGRLIVSGLNQRDFQVVFGIAWVYVIIVALTKLAADLIEIASNHFGRQAVSAVPDTEQSVQRKGVPRGWLVFALALVVISIIVAIVGPLLAPYGWNEISIQERLVAPSAEHLVGTDNIGRDVLSRLLYGVRTDVFAGLICAGVLSVVATGWAMLAAYFRRLNNWAGDFLEDLVTLPAQIIVAFPWLVLLLLLMSMVSLGPRFLPVVPLVSSLVLLPRAVSMIQETYRLPPEGRGLFRSTLRAVPVMLIFTVAGGMLYISTASYLGLGVPPPFPELGAMLTGAGMQFLLKAPWMALWPALCLVLLLLAWVMAGEALLERLGFRTKAVWSKIME